MQYVYMLLAILAGAMIPMQTGFNTQLGKTVGNAWSTSAMVLLIAALAMTLMAIAARAPLPTIAQTTSAPLTAWLGGVLGALYILALILLAPKLGAANLVAFVVVGQLLAALTIDHLGLIGFVVHQMNGMRIAGVALLIGGAALIRLS